MLSFYHLLTLLSKQWGLGFLLVSNRSTKNKVLFAGHSTFLQDSVLEFQLFLTLFLKVCAGTNTLLLPAFVQILQKF